MQHRTKRKLTVLSGYTVTIVIISAAATGYLLHWRMQDEVRRYAFMLKNQGIMLRTRGTRIQELSAQILSWMDSGAGKLSDNAQKTSLREYADAIAKQGSQLEAYGGKLIREFQDGGPGDALTTMADLQLIIPEDLDQIKQQQKKIQELEASSLILRSRLQELTNQLNDCRMQQWRNLYKNNPTPR